MRRTLIALASAGALAAAGSTVVPTQANALPGWVIPAIIGAGVVGVAVGATHSSRAFAYGQPLDNPPSSVVFAAPYAQRGENCRIMHERVPGGWHRVTVCG
jgi:hypothetical protein